MSDDAPRTGGSPPGSVLASWGLRFSDVSIVAGGLNNRHWRVESAIGSFALRRYGLDAVADGVAYEHSWLKTLSEAAVWVPRPVATAAGVTVVEAEGHLWALFEWLSGSGPNRLDATVAAGAGEALARAHASSEGMGTPRSGWGLLVDFADRPRWSGWTMRAALPAYRQEQPDLAETVASVVDRIEGPLEGRRQALEAHVVVVHYDLHPENLRVVNHRVGILDWDFAHPDARAVDLAIVLRNWPEGFDAFLAGYEVVSQLSPDEREALPLLAIARGLDHLADRLTRWAAGSPDPIEEIEAELADVNSRLELLGI